MRHFGWGIPRMNPLILGGEIREIEAKNPMDMDESPDVLGVKTPLGNTTLMVCSKSGEENHRLDV